MTRTHRIALTVLAFVIIAVVGAAAYLYWSQQAADDGGYSPYPHDPNAVAASSLPADLPTLNAGTFKVSLNPELQVGGDGKCGIDLVNPEGNPCYLMMDIRLADSNLLIYRTGLVNPGEGIGEITFVQDALHAMTPGEQDVALTVYTFKLGTYENLGDVNLGAKLRFEK